MTFSGPALPCIPTGAWVFHNLRPVEGYESVPKISEFFGISIYVYYRDHGPPQSYDQKLWIAMS